MKTRAELQELLRFDTRIWYETYAMDPADNGAYLFAGRDVDSLLQQVRLLSDALAALMPEEVQDDGA